MAPHKLCMIPGPIEFHEDVLAAMSTPATSHVDPNFIPIYGEAIEMVRKVVLTETAQPFIVSGSCTLGWDMMVNLIEPKDNVLVLSTGYFGDNFADCLTVYGANITMLRSEVGSRPSTEEVKKALSDKKYKMVTITHVDTSTGVLSDIQSIAHTVKSISPDTLVVVDGVCSLGSEEIRFDEWNLDIVISGSQKGLGVPPGLSVVVASQHALQIFKNRQTPVIAYYSNWNKWLPIMQAYEARKPSYFATPAVQLIYALHASLKAITSQPMEVRFEKHRAVAAKFRSDVRQLGLKTVAQSEEYAANGMTAIWLPEGIEIPQLVPALASKGVQIAGGILVGLAGKYFRIGHMGISVMEPERGHIDKVLEALTTSLNELGYKA
ncbi:PLP-dependent transferase [Rhizopus microsporus var. microsporus]|uniref:alanine--glyoxylate transaminase n=2 Tax=Rhizopus microsporus TaxID=58291 RepID=A0A2G4TA53_RHIZD|nr:PLP-dependent transferase [Rhizopus microsporus ATCC 52813]ORE00993.1 PLP-dependent transferase [Rhizopus microsporus var. microsporus]ORE00998.1 PLP-dependent transferase [Rhizopus microsporus var. microsporus]PHZ17894.1 PLP-dependent transferase [Rhizopus microsporus ATCC 52813]